VPVFILGNGPSLNDEDTTLLSNYFTIGINRAFYKIDPTILLWQDLSLWISERKRIGDLKCIKYCTSSSDPENKFLHFKVRPGNFELPRSPDRLIGSGSSGPLAVQFAHILGFNPICLLGFDAKPRGEDTDFYGKNIFHSKNTMNQFKKGMDWIKKISDLKIINIVNFSDNLYFPRASFLPFLNLIEEKHKQKREYWNQYLL
jgi:hypothetical protein